MRPKARHGQGGIDLIEEAVHWLRRAPAGVLVCYYLGAGPFVVGLLYFWADMSRSAFAEQRCAAAALGLALLFVWMKCWQTVFTSHVRAGLAGGPWPTWSLRRVGRLVVAQSFLQPTGLLVLPIALVITLPFGWAFAYYQGVTVVGDGSEASVRQVSKEAWAHARLWPGQNHQVLSIFLIFGLLVWLNLLSGVVFIPQLLRALFGVESVFTRSPHALFNTTLVLALFALTYLCVDPVLKTVYALRCFHGQSLRSGQDLKAELRRFAAWAKAPAAALVVLACGWTFAAPIPCDRELDNLLSHVRQKVAQAGRPLLQRLRESAQAPAWTPSSTVNRGVQILVLYGTKGCHDGLGIVDSVGKRATGLGATSQPAGVGTRLDRFAAASEPGPRGEAKSGQRPPGTLRSASVAAGVAPRDLDRSIDQVLERREFAWRMPREAQVRERRTDQGFLRLFFQEVFDVLERSAEWLGRQIGRLLEKLFGRSSSGPAQGSAFAWLASLQGLFLLLVIVLACLLAVVLLRLRNQRQQGRAAVQAEAIQPAPDLNDENVGADKMPEDGWLRLGHELAGRGDLRLALRAFYLSTLAHLAARGLISIAKFKSNQDYRRELGRRAHALPELLGLFGGSVEVFDRVWYGLHDVSAETIEQYAGNVERMRTC